MPDNSSYGQALWGDPNVLNVTTAQPQGDLKVSDAPAPGSVKIVQANSNAQINAVNQPGPSVEAKPPINKAPFIGPVNPSKSYGKDLWNNTQSLQVQNSKPSLVNIPQTQPANVDASLQPSNYGNKLWSNEPMPSRLSVTGVNNSPAPAPSAYQDYYYYPTLAEIAQKQGWFNGSGNKFEDFLTAPLRATGRFATGLLQPTSQGIADIMNSNEQNKISEDVAAGRTPASYLDANGITSLSNEQIAGHALGFGISVGGMLAGAIMSPIAGAVETGFEGMSLKTVAQKVAGSFLKNTLFSLPFAASNVMSNNEKGWKAIVDTATQTALYNAFGTGIEHGFPLLKYGATEFTDRVQIFQNEFEQQLIKQGVDPKLTHQLTTQGGFASLDGKPSFDGLKSEEPKPNEVTPEPQIKERGFIQSVKENPEMSQDLANNINGEYQVQTDSAAIGKAVDLINNDRQAATDLAMSDLKNKDSITTGIVLLKDANDRYIKSLNSGKPDGAALQEAQTLAEHLAVKGTEAGQTVQAFSQLSKKLDTPENALVQATKYVDTQSKGKLKLQPTDAKIIVQKASEIQKLPEGPERTYEQSLLAQKISDLVPSTKMSKAIALWKAGLVSAPTTKFIKAGSEASFNALTNVSDFVSTAFDKLAYLLTKTRTRSASLGGVMEQIRAIPAGLKSAKDYITTGSGSGLYDHLTATFNKYGIQDFHNETKFENPILNAYVNGTFRLLTGETRAYQEIAIKGSLFEQARVQALNEGLNGAAFKSRVAELYNEFKSTPNEQVALQAITDANYKVFQSDNALSSGISSLKRTLKEKSPVGSVIAEATLPFQKVPINIGKAAAIDYTPAGFLKAIWESVKTSDDYQAMGARQKAIVTSLGRATTGSAVIGLGAYLGAKGMLTGNLPTTKMERDQWTAEGKQANSILLGGRWYQIGRVLGPVGELLGLGSDMNNLSQDNHGVALAYESALAGVKKIGDLPFLMGISGELKAIQQPDQAGTLFAQNTAGSLVPNIITRLTKSIDQVERNPQGALQKIESNLPFLSKNVPAKRDLFGQPVINPGESGALLDPFMSRPNQPSPILDEANRVGANISAPSQTVYNTKLDNKDFSTFEKVQGIVIKAGLDALIKSESYKELGPSDQKKAIEDTVRSLRRQVDAATFPVLMIRKYNLPANTSPDLINNVFSLLGKNGTFKKMSSSSQKAKVQQIIGKYSH